MLARLGRCVPHPSVILVGWLVSSLGLAVFVASIVGFGFVVVAILGPIVVFLFVLLVVLARLLLQVALIVVRMRLGVHDCRRGFVDRLQ